MRRRMSVAAALAVALSASACSGGSGETAGATPPLVVHAIDQGSWQADFNPFALENVNIGTIGLIYEPLEFFNRLRADDVTPWLALKHQWSDGGKTLTFTLRQGVKFSDGQPLTPDDVAFTFDTLRQHPELNKGAIDLTGSKVTGPDTVQLSFGTPSYAKIWNIAGSVGIVQKRLFESQNPTTFTNPKPVGTGPYVLKSFSSQVYELAKNPAYWQPGKPVVPTVRFPANTANAVQTGLQQGTIDWAGAFVPDIQKIYVQGDPAHNKYYFPPGGLISLYLNLTEPAFAKPEVRQAISLAVDRDNLVKVAEHGYTRVAHPTGVPMPGGDAYLPPEYKDTKFSVDTAKAAQLLQQAGFRKSGDTMVDDKGDKLSFTLLVPSPFTDFVNAAQLIRADLAKIGVKVEARGVSVQEWVSSVGKGTYDMTIRGGEAGPTPYTLLRLNLASQVTKPVGQMAASNYERWKDATTDRLLAEYAATDGRTAQQKAIQGLGRIMVEKQPFLPLFYSAAWAQYRTNKYVGWPTEQDPYAVPAPYQQPDLGVVLLHLRPAKG
ncbi:ABC transporter substrate-binding protein [Actinoallomurus sp. CA-150999]|uniref:ABC transporter substrate-binding protein n=1 Tax=Actinoallomurus sp. CA-150999 TaxID=3239887 RepID=UPI003D8E411A